MEGDRSMKKLLAVLVVVVFAVCVGMALNAVMAPPAPQATTSYLIVIQGSPTLVRDVTAELEPSGCTTFRHAGGAPHVRVCGDYAWESGLR